eukprot:158997-Rhodomonas_salina.3
MSPCLLCLALVVVLVLLVLLVLLLLLLTREALLIALEGAVEGSQRKTVAERRGEGETEDIFGRQAYSPDPEWEDDKENDEDPSVFFVLGLMEPPAAIVRH